ncbi:MICOS complex subunit [Gryllus bimaculatus]|nr:MICOS complex subunit [Gryllus bimaculatus]
MEARTDAAEIEHGSGDGGDPTRALRCCDWMAQRLTCVSQEQCETFLWSPASVTLTIVAALHGGLRLGRVPWRTAARSPGPEGRNVGRRHSMFHNTFFLSPSEILGNVEHVVEDTTEFRPGVLVCCGQEAVNDTLGGRSDGQATASDPPSIKMALKLHYFKKFLLSGGTYAATALTSGDGQGGNLTGGDKETGKDGKQGQGESGDNCDPCTGKLMRRTDLPLYSETHPEKGDPCDEPPSNLEKGISAIRKELWVWSDKYEGYKEKIKDVVITGKEHSSVLIEQLRKDELPVPRAGAIAISGLAGVVLGLRGGWFRRIIYGSTCAGLMAAVCYPNEVADISEDTFETAKKYILITYNFIYGEKEPEASVRIIQPHECPVEPDGPDIPDAPECPVINILPHECPSKPDGPGLDEPTPEPIPESIPESIFEPVPEDPSCTCPLATGRYKSEQGPPFKSSFRSHFDQFAEESADVG